MYFYTYHALDHKVLVVYIAQYWLTVVYCILVCKPLWLPHGLNAPSLE